MYDVIRLLSLHAFIPCTAINSALSCTCDFGDRDSVVIIVARLGAGFVSDPKLQNPLWGPSTFTLSRERGSFSGVKAAWS